MTVRYPVAILDTKGEDLFSHLNVKTKLASINRDNDVIVYRPSPDELFDESTLDTFLLKLYDRPRSGIVYVDELTSLGDSPKAKPGLLSLYSRGRQHIANGRSIHTTTIGSTQAPFFVPRVVYRQSRSFALFRLNDKRDRETVARFTHPGLVAIPTQDHAFWYFLDTDKHPRQIRLKLT
jgi:hypothetical protein